jgi:flagellar biosynthesis/type III secretory pathway protein FliH
LDAARREFVPLARWLEPTPVEPEPFELETPQAQSPLDEPAALENVEEEAALSAVRRFRASLADALDASVAALREEIAIEIVARELQLGGVDIAGIVAHALARYRVIEPVTVFAHPEETAQLEGRYTVVADATLRRGDVRVRLQYGAIDATLGARLQRVLDRAP